MRTLSCDMWDLVPKSGIELRPSELDAQSLSHWTIREVLYHNSLDEVAHED